MISTKFVYLSRCTGSRRKFTTLAESIKKKSLSDLNTQEENPTTSLNNALRLLSK